jgi:uncharacterized protein DUF4235
MKLLFTPVSIAAGLLAGIFGKKVFERIWGMIDEEEPPDPKHREISIPKMLLALMLEGAIFQLARGLVDHAARRFFARATGAWPGREEPEPEPSS